MRSLLTLVLMTSFSLGGAIGFTHFAERSSGQQYERHSFAFERCGFETFIDRRLIH